MSQQAAAWMMAATLGVGCEFDTSGDSGPAAASVGDTDSTTDATTTSGSSSSSSGSQGVSNSGGVTSSAAENSSGPDPVSCSNGELDGDETDVDCGGTCPACPDGSACGGHPDCASAVCIGDLCEPGTCDDGIHGAVETDVDCGGQCEPCANGQGCSEAGDCIEAICSASVCIPASCNDGMLNGDESDVDCGGSCNACPIGDQCTAPPDCETGQCVGFVCGCTSPFSNGTFDSGLDGWQSTSGGCWGVGDDLRVHCRSDEISGHEMSAPINCVCTHPTVEPVITFSLRWDNDANAFDWQDGTARLEVRLDGIVHAVVNTPDNDGEVAAISYENGATGNLVALDEGELVRLELRVPPFPRPGPILSVSAVTSDRGDDFTLDDFTVEGAPCPMG